MKKRIIQTNGKRKSACYILVVMAMLMATILTACGSSKAAAPSTEAETTKVETAKEEVAEPATPPETKEVVEEVAEPEPTLEPTPEPIVYEGIDMESTLPGLEWVQTFEGIINEPKLALFNDETNKKVIIEKFDEVEFYDGDAIAVYIPKGKGVITSYSYFEDAEIHDNIIILNKLSSESVWDGLPNATCIKVGLFDGDDVKLYYYLKLMKE